MIVKLVVEQIQQLVHHRPFHHTLAPRWRIKRSRAVKIACNRERVLDYTILGEQTILHFECSHAIIRGLEVT
jgi:hypothetical protein